MSESLSFQSIFSTISWLTSLVGGPSVVLTALFVFWGRIILKRQAEQERKRTDEFLAKRKAEHDLLLEQIKSERELTLEQVKSANSRNWHAFSKKYDHEFALYEILWKAINELAKSAAHLRPTLDQVDQKKPIEQIKGERLLAFNTAASAARSIILSNKPFYSAEVYDAAMELDNACNSEAIQYQYGDPKADGRDYWQEGRENLDKIFKLHDMLCQRIRHRLMNDKLD